MKLSKEEKKILEVLVMNEMNYYKDIENKTKSDEDDIKQLKNILDKLNKESD